MLPGIQAAAVSDVVVCHGGSGTIYQALSQGVPVVGLVTNPDQMLVMRGVEAAGAGLGLLARTATATSVAGAVRRMLAEPGFRESARILARRIEACDAPAAFASFADKALDRKRPGPEAPAGEPAFDRSLAGRMNR
jgi:UDP:flavonoid glycosyltransferase YjiC (YdhE family)